METIAKFVKLTNAINYITNGNDIKGIFYENGILFITYFYHETSFIDTNTNKSGILHETGVTDIVFGVDYFHVHTIDSYKTFSYENGIFIQHIVDSPTFSFRHEKFCEHKIYRKPTFTVYCDLGAIKKLYPNRIVGTKQIGEIIDYCLVGEFIVYIDIYNKAHFIPI